MNKAYLHFSLYNTEYEHTVHTAIGANTFAIYGQGEEKELTELGAYKIFYDNTLF